MANVWPSPRGTRSQLCVFVGWLVRRQDYTKPTGQISMKLWWRVGLDLEYTTLTFGIDLEKWTDPRMFPLFL